MILFYENSDMVTLDGVLVGRSEVEYLRAF